jgi:hypothetical protein
MAIGDHALSASAPGENFTVSHPRVIGRWGPWCSGASTAKQAYVDDRRPLIPRTLGVVDPHVLSRTGPRKHLCARRRSLELTHEGDQVGLLLRGELQLHDQIEELHGILERQRPSIVQIGRTVFDPNCMTCISSGFSRMNPGTVHQRLHLARVSLAAASARLSRPVVGFSSGVGGKSSMFCIWAM